MNAAGTPMLFDDLPVPVRPVAHRAAYAGPCKPLRRAAHFANELVAAVDPARRDECYSNMIAALLAKDGANG